MIRELRCIVLAAAALAAPAAHAAFAEHFTDPQDGRVGETDHFVGARWLYLDLKTRLQAEAEQANLTPRELAQRTSELGLRWAYDSRDNIFTTSDGVEAAFDAMFAAPAFGSDNTFRTYRAHAFAYARPAERAVVAFRSDGRTARGDVPFYQLPFIDMRGIPAARYQDENIVVLEAEARFYVTPRWIALGFAGAGRAWAGALRSTTRAPGPPGAWGCATCSRGAWDSPSGSTSRAAPTAPPGISRSATPGAEPAYDLRLTSN